MQNDPRSMTKRSGLFAIFLYYLISWQRFEKLHWRREIDFSWHKNAGIVHWKPYDHWVLVAKGNLGLMRAACPNDDNVIRATERHDCAPQSVRNDIAMGFSEENFSHDFYIENSLSFFESQKNFLHARKKPHISSAWNSCFVKELISFRKIHPSKSAWIQCRVLSLLMHTSLS